MKKIILGMLLTLLITSCGTNNVIEEQPVIIENSSDLNTETEVEVAILNNEPLTETDENLEKSTTITYKSVEDNFKKLEKINIPDMELEELNNQINYIYINSINEEVLNKNDISLCNVLNDDESNYCKTNYIYNIALSEKSTEQCKALNDEMLISECNNYINGELAYIELDITLCDKITQSDTDIINCKSNVYKEIAISKKDIKYCDMIESQENQYIKDDCQFEVEMYTSEENYDLSNDIIDTDGVIK